MRLFYSTYVTSGKISGKQATQSGSIEQTIQHQYKKHDKGNEFLSQTQICQPNGVNLYISNLDHLN